MNNLFDYIAWRGDLSFKVSPFNDVDSLIMCKLSCNDLKGFVPPPGQGSVKLKDAAEEYFAGRDDEDIKVGLIVPHEVVPLFRAMSECARFSSMELGSYVNDIDENQEMQFCALTIDPGDGAKYIAFRGTDDTLVGWKENFNMSYRDAVPAQLEAVGYLRDAASSSGERLRVGGHSKGGNLSVYAAMHVEPEVQDRIINVYNFDGPGFGRAVLAEERYKRIRPRIKTILPQTSIVGMLLEHEETFEIVKSRALGAFQHDGFTWEVLGTDFIRLDEVTAREKYLDERLRAWVTGVDVEQRHIFTETLFSILESTGAKTLTDLTAAKLKNARAVINSMRSLDKDTKEVLYHTIRLLIRESIGIPRLKLRGSPRKKSGDENAEI